MSNTTTVGAELRTLRQRLDLTLQDVAQRMGISAPTLSRIERGEKEIDRHCLERVIRAYQLTPWEAFRLWAGAGFIPQPDTQSIPPRCVQDLAEKLLLPLPSPACILDKYGYVKAWNQDLEAIRPLSSIPVRPVHIIDSLFMNQTRQRMGQVWERYAVRVLQFCYHRVHASINEPEIQDMISTLSRRYGTTFTHKWYEAQQAYEAQDALVPDVLESTALCSTPYGTIEFLLMSSVFYLDYEYELVTLVPFGPQSHEIYQQFKAAINGNKVHFS